MTRLIVSTLIALIFGLRAALAQDDATWIQIEAHDSLLEAEDRVRDYSGEFSNVNGFSIGSGWYVVALGPYNTPDAVQELTRLRSQGQIPRDSFIARSESFRRQFWPVGADLLANPPVAPTEQAEPAPQSQAQSQTPAVEPQAPDETPAEARRSEAQLDSEARRGLQIALQWAGFYDAAIDGAFGRGTRGAMAQWQEANGFTPTGILTTRQRGELFRQYNSVLEGMDLQLVRDTTAGIEVKVPLGVVAFDKHEAPFARFTATGETPAQVLLISQRGDQARLYGLYDILQTLEAVPLDGERERRSTGFTIIGENSRIVSHTEVGLRNGEIKGFMLIWPAGDEERRRRILTEMQQSFTRLDGVMSSDVGVDSNQSVDLLSGLKIRKPRISRTGFYVADNGTVLTTSEAVQGCERVTLDEQTEAQVALVDETLGLALLTPQATLAPMEVAELATRAPRLQSEVAVAGFSYGGVLGAPSLTYGRLVDLRGLDGEETLNRFALTAQPGDAGGPVMDGSGAVIGMLRSRENDGRQLPVEVNFSTDAAALESAMRQAGISARVSRNGPQMAPEDLTQKARGMAVLVSCWD